MLFLLGGLSEGCMQGHVWRKRIGVQPYCNKPEPTTISPNLNLNLNWTSTALEHSHPPMSTQGRPSPYPKAYPLYYLGTSSREGGTEAPPTVCQIHKSLQWAQRRGTPPLMTLWSQNRSEGDLCSKDGQNLSHESKRDGGMQRVHWRNLKAGKIQKSQLLQASPFFFVQKKDRGLCPCQDYWYLNEHTVKMPTCSPSSPLLLTNSKEQNTSQKWTFDGGTTTSASRKGTSGRLPLPPPLASMNR